MQSVAYLFVALFLALNVACAAAAITLNIFELDPTVVCDAAIFGATVISGAMAAAALAKRWVR
jgi:hypothetical protein